MSELMKGYRYGFYVATGMLGGVVLLLFGKWLLGVGGLIFSFMMAIKADEEFRRLRARAVG